MHSALESFRRPEYTGENRCLPCTVVNVVIAVFATGIVAGAALELATPATAAMVGGTVAGVSLLAIYLRGYLLPGTPTLTARYLPDRVLTAFDKEPMLSAGEVEGDGVDAETVLVNAGALEPCADGEDLCLTETFRTAWREQLDRDTDATELLAELGIECDGARTDASGDGCRVFADGGYVGTWESAAAVEADAAASQVLGDSVPEWSTLSTGQRSQVLSGLRLFLDRCPSCRGPTEFGSAAVDSCCTNQNVMAVTCGDCGARLFEKPVETMASDM
jgi:hypothetical protein